MPRYFAFLRAINVGGHTVTMARLRELFEAEKLNKVTTYLAAGNISFETRSTAPAALEKRLARRLHEALGYPVATFLRTDAELIAAHAYQPYTPRELTAAHTLCIGFMATAPGTAARAALTQLCSEVDQYHLNGRELYHLCSRGLSESLVTGKQLEKALGTPVTMRNVKTVTKLVEIVTGEGQKAKGKR
jgi:uncharacterized protein (DUF1697 family)